MLEEAIQTTLKKGRIEKEKVEFLIAGDLINQMTPTSFAASTSSIPFLGTFSACATSMESLALAASIINAKGGKLYSLRSFQS